MGGISGLYETSRLKPRVLKTGCRQSIRRIGSGLAYLGGDWFLAL